VVPIPKPAIEDIQPSSYHIHDNSMTNKLKENKKRTECGNNGRF
jgi:hypothetical protein